MNILSPSVDINDILDGKFYQIKQKKIEAGNYTGLVRLKKIILKVPAAEVLQFYEELFERERVIRDDSDSPNRQPTGLECGSKFQQALTKWPDFVPLIKQCRKLGLPIDEKMAQTYAYYLITHKMNHQRLIDSNKLSIPRTRFIIALISKNRLFGLRSPLFDFGPVIVQEYLKNSIPLWDMYNPRQGRIKNQYAQYINEISAQLSLVFSSGFNNYLDYSPENFLYCMDSKKLFYVDIEPSFLVSQEANKHNFNGMLRFFKA